MANSGLLLPFLNLFLLSSLNSEGMPKLAQGQTMGQGAWCVAKPSLTEQELTDNINYACGAVNCSLIERGGSCYSPNTLVNHASVAMNLFYQKSGRFYWNCDFKKSGIITVTDPSYGNCRYEFTPQA